MRAERLARRAGAALLVLAALRMLAGLLPLATRAPATAIAERTMSAKATAAGARLRLQTQRCREGAADGAGAAPIVVRAVRGDGKPVSWQRALEAMRREDDFQDALSASVREAPWEAVFFETRPTSSTTAAEDVFEFVLVPSRGLQTVATADLETFAEQLAAAESAGRATAVFTNLGGDATLVVPTIPAALADAQDAFRHVGPYFRATKTLPGSTRALWQSIAESMTERMSQRGAQPVWLSTSGLGVYYLHFRLDDRPKYYTYAPFKGWP